LTMASAERQSHQRGTDRSTRGGPQRSISGVFSWILEHADLVAQSQVLEPQGSTRTEDRRQSCEKCRERNQHRREL
jgi:hypothetical protein